MSAPKTMKPGDTVYSQHGQQAELVAASGGEFIVRPIYEDDDGEHTGDVETWRAAFRTPPAPKLDQQTAEAEKRLAELQLKVSEANAELWELTKNEKARMDRIKQHEGLAMLDRYLAGEITHYVSVHDYYPTVEIIPIGETVENYSSTSGYGLLSIMPSRHWDKKIIFSVYYEQKGRRGYSTTDKVFPCCGEEEAKAKAVELVRQYVSDYEAKEPARRSYFDQLVAQCAKYGVDVPAKMIAEQAELHNQNVRTQISTKQAEIAKLAESITNEVTL